jgi:hypothetical protein
MNVPGFHAQLVHLHPVKRHIGIKLFHQILEPGKLKPISGLNFHTFVFRVIDHDASLKSEFKLRSKYYNL